MRIDDRFSGPDTDQGLRRTRRQRVRALFLSDVHLGTRASKSEKLCEFLRHHDADTIYLHRELLRAAHVQADPLVARLRAQGRRVDCWTIDHGSPEALADLCLALAAGCDQITTNSAAAWAAARL